MDEYERFVFDTQGCIVLENLLSKEEVDRLKNGLPRDANGEIIREPDNQLLSYEEPLFRELINHPGILPYLQALLADFHSPEDEPWHPFLEYETFMYMKPGETSTTFHHGSTPFTPWYRYTVQGGKMYCGLLTMIWCLSDAKKGEGGFWYVPGSHQANFPKPPGLSDYSWIPDCVVQPAVRAGSAILFTEALVHGTRPWKAQHDRYVLFYRYLPGYMGLGKNNTDERSRLLTEAQKQYVTPTQGF
jgi:hypothetical protein